MNSTTHTDKLKEVYRCVESSGSFGLTCAAICIRVGLSQGHAWRILNDHPGLFVKLQKKDGNAFRWRIVLSSVEPDYSGTTGTRQSPQE